MKGHRVINEEEIDGKEDLWSDQRTRFVVEGCVGGRGWLKFTRAVGKLLDSISDAISLSSAPNNIVGKKSPIQGGLVK